MSIVAKPRKAMAIIVLIIAFLGAVLATIILPISISKAIQDMNDGASGNGAGAAIGAIFVAMVLVIIIFAVFVDAIVCVPFLVLSLIFTRLSTLKWARILSYITDGLCAYVIIVAIFKLIQLMMGV